MSKIFKKCYRDDRIPQEWFSLEAVWKCDKGNNPGCITIDEGVEEEMKKCGKSEGDCGKSCVLYRGGSLRDPMDAQVRVDGPFYLRTVHDGSWYDVLIQQK